MCNICTVKINNIRKETMINIELQTSKISGNTRQPIKHCRKLNKTEIYKIDKYHIVNDEKIDAFINKL